MELTTNASGSLDAIRDELDAYKRAYCAEHIAQAIAYYVNIRSTTYGRALPSGMTRPEYQREYQRANQLKRDEYHHAYYLKHRERDREARKAYERANPAKRHAIRHNRMARKRRNGGAFTGAEWNALCHWFGNVCLCCGANSSLTVDHVIPIAKGGPNSVDNLQPLCGSCNASKGAKATDYRDPALLAAFLDSQPNMTTL